jgi:hypothetical protein
MFQSTPSVLIAVMHHMKALSSVFCFYIDSSPYNSVSMLLFVAMLKRCSAFPDWWHAGWQVFCGNASKSISVWEPPSGQMQDKVILNGHTGWVRALAAEGRWLFRYRCSPAFSILITALVYPLLGLVASAVINIINKYHSARI